MLHVRPIGPLVELRPRQVFLFDKRLKRGRFGLLIFVLIRILANPRLGLFRLSLGSRSRSGKPRPIEKRRLNGIEKAKTLMSSFEIAEEPGSELKLKAANTVNFLTRGIEAFKDTIQTKESRKLNN